jgi:ParB family chromosome partitioning protein
MTLDEAALFAEFEDEPRDIDRLTAAWNDPWTRKRLAHVAQEVRDERAERAAVLKEVERLRGEGLPVFDPDTIPSAEVWRLRLDELRDADDQPVPPERWASILGAGVLVEAEWDGEDRPVFTPTWVCQDPEAAGLHRGYRITPTPDARTAPTGEESDEERVEREAADLARREAESDQRRQVLANNKAWRSAQTVRRQWLTGLLARRVVPKGAEVLIARALVGRAFALTYAMEHGHTLLATVLGITGPDTRPGARVADRVLEQATTAKAATMRTLGAVLAAWEDRSDVHTWRHPGTFDGEVMAALIGWGYPATDVERLLVPDAIEPGEQDQPDPADEQDTDDTDPDTDAVGSDEDDLPVDD